MNIQPTTLPDVFLITPKRFSDARGYFMETFRQDLFQDQTGAVVDFVQENQSLSAKANTIRGLHYQSPPHAQGKLVRCLQGGILDIAVDVRKNSPHYGKAIAVELTADNDKQLWVPAGFLHGFRTLTENTLVSYKCTSTYSHAHEGTVSWNDPELNIDWGTDSASEISERDANAMTFSDFKTPFKFESKA